MSRPQVIDDEEHERVHDRVAAIDVAKDSGMVCTRTPHPSRPGARRSTVWTVKARMGAIGKLGRQLKRDGIEIVTLESTSDYWRIWFFVLETCGLAVQLVNAAQARNLPGRPKTDKLDAQWLARLTEMGLLRASFVPPKAIRDLRDYTRMRIRLVQERTRCWQRLEKLLEGALVKVSAVASSLTTLSAQDMIKAMIAGERDPRQLAGLARGRMRAKHDTWSRRWTACSMTTTASSPAAAGSDRLPRREDRPAHLASRRADHGDAAAWGVNADGTTGPDAGPAGRPGAERRGAAGRDPRRQRGPGPRHHRRTGLDMSRFPAPPTWCRGPGVPPAASPAPAPAREERPGQRNLRGSSARPPPPPPARHLPRRALLPDRPPPRQAKAQVAVARPSWSASGTCSPTRAGTPTWLRLLPSADKDKKINSEIERLVTITIMRRTYVEGIREGVGGG